jgi:hypothetical protein
MQRMHGSLHHFMHGFLFDKRIGRVEGVYFSSAKEAALP